MVREVLKNDVPDEWRRRYRAGLCPVCAKTKDVFDKGQRVFCSKKCRDEYASKYTSWSEVREKILQRDNETCTECGITTTTYREQIERQKDFLLKDWLGKNQDWLLARRDVALVRLDERYAEDFAKIMDDVVFAKREIDFEVLNNLFADVPNWLDLRFEVDHVRAVALGGSMWDEKNLRVLCSDCHKKKTRDDWELIAKQNHQKKVEVVRKKHKPLDGLK